ncbi:MAG: hypothetical protein HYZ44_06880 [Bacteroidetes bacterium]|nr:hypothetical protein [Bacteroidota bacterium]
MIRRPVYLFLVVLSLWKCAPQEKKTSKQTNPDSLSINSTTDKIESIAPIIPIDTIVANYPSGQKLHLYILAYHDSLPGKPIKDFEVRDAEKNETVFRSVTMQLKLGYETDPMEGEYDSLFVVPTYSISSKDPLAVDLEFSVEGGFTSAFLGDITYPFYEKSSNLNYLRYTFNSSKNWEIESSLLFHPYKCSVNKIDLMAQFHKIKREGNITNHVGGEFLKLCFICYMNGSNANYELIKKEFIENCGESYFPGNYYIYVVYLDRFIKNLTSR